MTVSKTNKKRGIVGGGGIQETIYLTGFENLTSDADDRLKDFLTDFCVDLHGRIRLGCGWVAMGEERQNDMNYVPSARYEIECSPWNSHSDYVIIDLPNPADDFEDYQFIRSVFINEIERRLNVDLRKKDLK